VSATAETGTATATHHVLDDAEWAAFQQAADALIPEAHGMPSARTVVTGSRLTFVLGARPDLLVPLKAALRPGLGADAATRFTALEKDDPAALAALQLVVVGGYYTDRDVRERLAYPGQLAKTISVWRIPDYVHEGLIDAVQKHGPVWRDPETGQRATPERQGSDSTDEGGRDGRDSA
jgi:hypothetical protein